MNESRTSGDESPLTPSAALGNATEVDAKARRVARWPAWVWLAMAVTMAVHLIGSPLVPDGWPRVVVGLLPLVFAVSGIIYSARQQATSRLLSRLVWPVTGAFVVLVFAAVLLQNVVFPQGAVPGIVLSGLLPAIPCVYGAWRVLAE